MAEEHDVVLFLYDLTQGMAKVMSPALLGMTIEGVWHTGVVVYGSEYFFGGGIQWCPPGHSPAGQPLKRIPLGKTSIPKSVFHDFLREINPRFTQETYSLINHNCNNFSDEVAQFLVGKPIPDYITGLPEAVFQTPMGAMLRPVIEGFENSMKNQLGTNHIVPGFGQDQQNNNSLNTNTTAQSQSPQASNSSPDEDEHKDVELRLISGEEPVTNADKKAEMYLKNVLGSRKIPEDLALTQPEQQVLRDFLAIVYGPKTDKCPPGCFELFDRMLLSWPVATLTNALALFRLLVLRPDGSEHYCSTEGFTVVKRLISRCQATDAFPVKLMLLCCLVNLFAHPPHRAFVSSHDCVLDAALSCIDSKHANLRYTAAVLLQNCAMSRPKDDCGDDQAVRIASAVIEHLPGEDHAQTRYRLLMALGQLVHHNSEMCSLMVALDFDLAAVQAGTAKNAKQLLAEIRTIFSQALQ